MNADLRASLLDRLPGRRILIVGDLMLDEFLWGHVRRISPEAPVPVVDLHKRSHVPGGAANTAANVAGLGGQARLLGVVGEDEAGRLLRRSLEGLGIDCSGVLIDPSRPTTTKTRIIAHSQQVVRIDHECRLPLPAPIEARVLKLADEGLAEADACIVADYAKGLVSPTLARQLIRTATELGKPVIVDPKGSDFGRFRGASVIKPNLHEAGLFLGREVGSVEDVEAAGRGLLEALGCRGVLLTRGADGMALFEPATGTVLIAAQAREVFDVTGAGDTVAGTLALALAAGAGLEQAARLASRAAGVVVGRVGTAAIRWEDLKDRHPDATP
jgi:D-beta-D-heptose 7-phosphate kinase/D-beta-D-heptose 1-phosphate adenosyltransferase